MTTNTYLKTCAAVAVLTALAVLFVPGAAALFEGLTLQFLATNATTAP
ncbi:MAG: hypothetical protein AAF515_20120 [Pseudomonadota bacterium]